MLQTLIDQKTVKPGNWSSLTVFLWFQLSKMGLYNKTLAVARVFWYYTYFFSNNVAAASGLNTVQDIFNMF